ncbi:MAG: imm11 family protein [Myxococcota bacterium]
MNDTYEQDYFVYYPPPFSEAFPYPRLAWGETSSGPFHKGRVLERKQYPEFVEWTRVKKPQYPECFKLSGTWPVVAERVWSVLAALNLYGMDLHPARVLTRKKENLPNYKLVHVWNKFLCIDRERSQATWEEFPENRIREPISLRLDREVMAAIPLERRLVFRPEEESVAVVFHRTVVEKLMAIRPTGIMFAPFATANYRWLYQVFETPFPPVVPEKPSLLRKPPTLANQFAARKLEVKPSRPKIERPPRIETKELFAQMKAESARRRAGKE